MLIPDPISLSELNLAFARRGISPKSARQIGVIDGRLKVRDRRLRHALVGKTEVSIGKAVASESVAELPMPTQFDSSGQKCAEQKATCQDKQSG